MAISDLIGGLFSENTAKAVAKGQFGFININKMHSTNRELEKDIVERYDSQLKEIQAQINDGIAKAFGSAQIDSAIDP